MEAEVQELPMKREPSVPEDFYGTAARPRTRRRHTMAWIALSLALIVVSTFGLIATMLHIRLEKQGGVTRIVLVPTETTEVPEDPVRNLEVASDRAYSAVPNEAAESVQLKLPEAEGETLTPSELYARVSPAVVCVQTEDYYGTCCYTGVIISDDGYVLSATEGLGNVSSVTVCCADGTQYAASRVAEERVSGLCLLKVEAAGLPTVALAQDGNLTVGQSVYCICNPYGSRMPNVFVEGMLAAQGSVELGSRSYTLLQTSARWDGGGYGCPILDSRGLVVGLTAPVGKRVVSGEDPCFAISSADLTRTIALFEKSAAGKSCWLGLEVADIPENYLRLYNFPGKVWITDVAVDSAPYGVLYQYDVITAVEGTEVNSAEEFERLIAGHKAGDRVRLTIFRSGNWYTILLPVMSH